MFHIKGGIIKYRLSGLLKMYKLIFYLCTVFPFMFAHISTNRSTYPLFSIKKCRATRDTVHIVCIYTTTKVCKLSALEKTGKNVQQRNLNRHKSIQGITQWNQTGRQCRLTKQTQWCGDYRGQGETIKTTHGWLWGRHSCVMKDK